MNELRQTCRWVQIYENLKQGSYYLQLHFLGFVLLLLVAGCAHGPAIPTRMVSSATAVSPTVTTTATYMPSPTSTSSPSATATMTPSPTPTPTATAVPITIAVKPVPTVVSTPERNGRYPCGAVDTFDFPIDPPDASRVSRGGGDFGIFRERYDKYHAGEDWGGISGRTSNLGTPVHSIGHGLVTYAQPLGWGRDQGVIILQHTFRDGQTILSFYGHLEPDSVLLTPGQCVVRGEQIGKIGQPRGFPHLHFEMRTQSPYTPLTGYWPEDPTSSGWLWPSQMIWNQRVTTAPGVLWSRPFSGRSPKALGFLDAYFLLLEDDQVTAVEYQNGSRQTIALGVERLAAATVDSTHSFLYTANRSGQIEMFKLPQTLGTAPESLWQIKLDELGLAHLQPMPNGGVIAAWHSKLYAISDVGELLWQMDVGQRPYSWTLSSNALLFSTSGAEGALWLVQAAQRPLRLAVPAGKLTASDEWIWIFSQGGIYRLSLEKEAPTATLAFALPDSTLARDDITSLIDGGVLIIHNDPFDRRLIALAGDGTLRWQRSIRNLPAGKQSLTVVKGQPYLISQTSGQNGELMVYAIDMTSATLEQVFSAGTRTVLPNDTWAFPVDDTTLIINVGGGPMAHFDPQAPHISSPR